ncbi:MAG: response regulator [Pseudomonadota bacterium]
MSELKVLIVDDSALLLALLRRVLMGMNIREVIGVADGEAALSALERIRPDLVFADRRMTPFDGLEFVRRVRGHADGALSRTPIVMITNPAEEYRVQLARDAGVNAILVEPISPPAIMTRVLQVLSDARDFIRSPAHAGPDRRLRSQGFDGPERRRADAVDLPQLRKSKARKRAAS